MASSDIFPKFNKTIKLATRQDGDGNEIEVRGYHKSHESIVIHNKLIVLG